MPGTSPQVQRVAKRFLPPFFSLVFIFSGCVTSCVESKFELGETSRLPSWCSLPSGLTRSDIQISITFYTVGDVEFEIRGPRGVLARETGRHQWHPSTLKKGFVEMPSYSIISVRGIADIYEQRKEEPFLYITDDPKLTDVLRQSN